MSRKARQKCESGIFHVMLRGINKQTIFEDDKDRDRFIDTIRRYKDISKYELYGFCLMSNHIHLLLKEVEDEISNVIKRICSSYVYWYNNKYSRYGHLFQERYKSECIDTDEYSLTVLRYIHQNPIKAGLVKKVSEYKWSSYNLYMQSDPFIDKEFILGIYSEDKQKSVDLFIQYTNEKHEDKCLEFEDKVIFSDIEVIEHIKGLGLLCVSELQSMKKDKRDEVLRKLKGVTGISLRQLSRVTGISKSVIGRA